MDFGHHLKVALQLSGKDSMVVLLLLAEDWDRLTVYHVNSGDEDPQLTEFINWARERVPNFVEIRADIKKDRIIHGLPTDILPWSSDRAAHVCNVGFTPLMQTRVECCWMNIMYPLHERMIADGITLVIRGQKKADKFKGPLNSGDAVEGMEVIYPIEDWTDEQCFQFLRNHKIPIPAYYEEGLVDMGDCLTCTAWNDDSRAEYLHKHYPDAYPEYRKNLLTIREAIQDSLKGLTENIYEPDYGL